MNNHRNIKRHITAFFLIAIILLSGCIALKDNDYYDGEEYLISEKQWVNESYQFNNLAPMGMGNITYLNFTDSEGKLYFDIEIYSLFHNSSEWSEGFVNVSLINDNETIWTYKTNNTGRYIYTDSNTFKNINPYNLKMVIQAQGTDNLNDSLPGDYYVVKSHYNLHY